MIPLRIIIIIAIKNYERRLESFHSFFEWKKKSFNDDGIVCGHKFW